MDINDKAKLLVRLGYSLNLRDARRWIRTDDMMNMAQTEKQVKKWCRCLETSSVPSGAHVMCASEMDRRQNMVWLQAFEKEED